MKLWKAMCVAGSMLVLLTGMGNLGGGPEGTVPKTDENIHVKLTDIQGETTELTQFSMDGRTSFEGTRGSAQVTILFRNVASAEFAPLDGKDEMTVTTRLKDGGEVQLHLRKRVLFYGSTGYGAYQIKARDIKRIELIPAQ